MTSINLHSNFESEKASSTKFLYASKVGMCFLKAAMALLIVPKHASISSCVCPASIKFLSDNFFE